MDSSAVALTVIMVLLQVICLGVAMRYVRRNWSGSSPADTGTYDDAANAVAVEIVNMSGPGGGYSGSSSYSTAEYSSVNVSISVDPHVTTSSEILHSPAAYDRVIDNPLHITAQLRVPQTLSQSTESAESDSRKSDSHKTLKPAGDNAFERGGYAMLDLDHSHHQLDVSYHVADSYPQEEE